MSKHKKYDVIVVGELNVDLIMDEMSSLPEMGTEKLAGSMKLTLGSSSAIFASNLASMGSKVAFVGQVGNDIFGDYVLNCLNEKKVDTSSVKKHATLQTGATIGLNFKEDRAMVTHLGAMEKFGFSDIDISVLDNARHLHFSSYFFQPALQAKLAELFKTAKQKGLTTSFDIQCDPYEKWVANLSSITPYIDIFFLNEKEILELTKCENTNDAIEKFEGLASLVVLKLGSKGSLCIYDGNRIQQPAFLNDNVIDTIGAGDSFNAGFIYQYLQDAPLETCQKFGNLAGAFSTTAAGGTGAFNEVNKFLIHANGILSNSYTDT
jgi:sugar/nucleoside kinase (ribokinase family)